MQIVDDGKFDSWATITAKALPGFPIAVDSKPAAGARFVGVEINGKLYGDSVFTVSAAATIKPFTFVKFLFSDANIAIDPIMSFSKIDYETEVIY